MTGGLAARTARGAIGASWWSQRFTEVLESFALGSRLTRGRAYARRGQVIDLAVAAGVVTARVQGSRAKPYKVAIGLAPFSARIWADVDTALAAQAIHTAALLAGEFPAGLEGVLAGAGAQLFPRAVSELRMTCSCPDWEIPCKHLAATFYLLAERFDDDPFEILHWRGRPREVLLTRVRELRSTYADTGAGGPGSRASRSDGTTSGGPGPGSADASPSAVCGAASALADLPDPATSPARYWHAPIPLPPAPVTPDVPADLMLRQLPEPGNALGGEDLSRFLRAVYAALPGPENAAPRPDEPAIPRVHRG